MALLYLAWKHGGHDPYRLYNMLDETYRPVDDPTAEPHPPLLPSRVQNVVYAFAATANEVESGKGGARR